MAVINAWTKVPGRIDEIVDTSDIFIAERHTYISHLRCEEVKKAHGG
jgi:hypothetical protein